MPRTDSEGNPIIPEREVPPGSTAWNNKINKALIDVLSYYKDPTGNVSQTNAMKSLNYLLEQQSASPEEYRAIANSVTGFIEAAGGTVPDIGQDQPEVQDLLNRILGNAGGPSSTSSETRFRSDEKTTSGSITEESTLTKKRVFVDVPTAEEFLDDFQTGLRGHLQDLQQAGQLSSIGMELAMSQEDELLDMYLGELAQRASRGEQIFETVGATGDPKKVGERVGDIMQRGTVGGRQAGSTTETDSRTVEEGATSGGGGGAGGGGSFKNEERRLGTSTEKQTDLFQNREHAGTIEEIYERPNLALVKTLSPGEFLKEQFGEGQLETFLRSRKGTRQRVADTAQGAPVLNTRRV